MTFEYRCPTDGPFDSAHPIGQAPPAAICPMCCTVAERYFSSESVFNFQEDRIRFARPHQGTRFSAALGQDIPDSRSELNRLCKEKGIEFVGSDLPPNWKAAREYGQHLKAGGERLPQDAAAAMMEPPKTPAVTVTELLKKSNFSLPDALAKVEHFRRPAFPENPT